MKKLLLFLAGLSIVLAAVLMLPKKEQGVNIEEELYSTESHRKNIAFKPVERKPFEITLIHSNDSHSVLENVDRSASLIEEIRDANENSLLLSAGDVTSWEIGKKAEDALANAFFMNYLGFDGMVLGNHEFDLGEGIWNHEALGNYITDSAFPVLASNVDFSKDEFLRLLADDQYTDKPVNGRINKGYTHTIGREEIGIFGITHFKEVVTVPGDVSFRDYTEAAKEAVAHFEALGIDKIIALTHIGIGNDRRLAKAVPEIDVIIGGHSHVTTSPPNRIGDTLVLQAGEYNTYIGELNLVFDLEGKISEHTGKLHNVAEAVQHTETKELMEIYNQALAAGISTYEGLVEFALESGVDPANFGQLP